MMAAMTVANSIKAQLDEAAHVMKRQMERIAELEDEVARLKANASAHQTLASIYADPNQPTGHRIKAAGLALGVETPRLESVPPAIDATCEEYKPLAQVVEERRARARVLLATDPKYKNVPREVYSTKGDKTFVYRVDDGSYEEIRQRPADSDDGSSTATDG
jgi:hypothetical protein